MTFFVKVPWSIVSVVSFTSIFERFCTTCNPGVSGFSCRIFFIFESLQLNELKLFENLRDKVILP